MVLAVAVAALMRFLHQPLIVGYILTGVLVGPSFLHIIPEGAPLQSFGNIGIALLLFIIGLGLNATIIKRLGKVVLVTASLQIGLTALIAYLVAAAMGFAPQEAAVIGVALTFSSTIIIIKLINDKHEQTRLYAQISIGILLIQDVVASLALIFIATIKNGGGTSDVLTMLLVKSIIVGPLLILVSGHLLPRLSRFVAGSQEFLFLFALAWGFGIATLFEQLGFSIAVGALFAGISLAPLPYSSEIAARLKPLRDFFVVVFFIALGLGLQINNMGSLWLPALVFSGLVVLIKPFVALISMSALLGYTRRTSFKSAVTLGQISEFSLILVLLIQASGLVSQQISTIITIVALVTIAVSTYLMKYDEQVFLLLERSLGFLEHKNVKPEHRQGRTYSLVLFGHRKGGEGLIKSFKALHKSFVVVDYNPEVIEHLEHQHLPYLYGDASDLELLEELGLHRTKLLISTINDFDTNKNLVTHALKANSSMIVICHASSYQEAVDLYHLGATYVMLPHMIGSEHIGSFIKHAGLRKKEFVNYREKHLMLLEKQTAKST